MGKAVHRAACASSIPLATDSVSSITRAGASGRISETNSALMDSYRRVTLCNDYAAYADFRSN
jgi:hypothetical protein